MFILNYSICSAALLDRSIFIPISTIYGRPKEVSMPAASIETVSGFVCDLNAIGWQGQTRFWRAEIRPYRVKSLDNTSVFSAGLSLSGHISAPAKLPAPASDGYSSDFWLLRRRLAESAYSRRCCRATFPWSEAGASQGEKGKKRRKDTLAGVFALVIRWYAYASTSL